MCVVDALTSEDVRRMAAISLLVLESDADDVAEDLDISSKDLQRLKRKLEQFLQLENFEE